MNRLNPFLLPLLLLLAASPALTGCAPAVVAAGGGGYSMATDERTVGQQIDDATITTKVKGMLLDDHSVPAMKIDVDTIEGNVILTGVVDTREQKEKALEIARKVQGVKKVTDNMQVGLKTWGDAWNDEVLVTKINKDLLMTPGIRTFNIDVDADLGVVTLTGVVDTPANKQRIIDIARRTPGVKKIVDNLTLH